MKSTKEVSATEKLHRQLKTSAEQAVSDAINRHAKLGEETVHSSNGDLIRKVPSPPNSK